MFLEVFGLILDSAEGAFIEVGAFVGAILLLFGYINYKKSGKFIEAIEKSKGLQPIIGGLLGLTPGCGGAIFVMPLFFKKSVTFGTVVATLMTTMGDAAFVMIAAKPLHYLAVSFIALIVGVTTGYIVDATSIGDKLLARYLAKVEKDVIPSNDESDNKQEYSHNHKKRSNIITYIFWSLISIGLILGVMDIMQFDINELFIPNLGLLIGVSGTALAVFIVFKGKKFLRDDTLEEEHAKVISLKRTFIQNALETAFVILWVFVGFLAYEFLIFGVGGANYQLGEEIVQSWLLATGVISIIIGVAVGIIPGCGPQIIFVTLFANGLVPFSALLANAISQDGDALFPLLAVDRRSALYATLINKIPALIIALMVYWVEIRYDWGALLNTLVYKVFM